jgi:glycosyltransferase involved in cell wall biosynthesis
MKLAICVAIKNRSLVIVDPEDSLSFLHHVQENIEDCPSLTIHPWVTKQDQIALALMPKMLRSLMDQRKPTDDWVLVVVDYGSTDVNMREMIEYEVGTKIPWHLETVTDYAYFDRGGGLAKAAAIAEAKFTADAVFFCDADLQFASHELFDKMTESLTNNHFFYPIFFSFALADHSKGLWRDTSFGNFATSIENYKKTDGWLHNISWGWEDRALSDSIPEQLKDRMKIEGFYHQWHPLQWEFRVKEYPEKGYLFKAAAVKTL